VATVLIGEGVAEGGDEAEGSASDYHPHLEGSKRRSDSSGTSEGSRSTATSERQAVLVRADAALEALIPRHNSLHVTPPPLQHTHYPIHAHMHHPLPSKRA
jgi:hypothetical protein